MLQIDALPAFSDNYIWLLQDTTHKRCAVVDPGDAAPVLAWLDLHPGYFPHGDWTYAAEPPARGWQVSQTPANAPRA